MPTPPLSTLANSPADILAYWLVANSYGIQPDNSATDWQVFESNTPDEPDNKICVYDDGDGLDHGRTMPDNERAQMPGWLIQVDHRFKELGYIKANAIARGLDQIVMSLVAADGHMYRIQSVMRQSNIIHVGEIPGKRVTRYTLSGVMSVRQLA